MDKEQEQARVCTWAYRSPFVVIAAYITALISMFQHFFLLLPLGSFVNRTWYLLKKSTLILLFNGRNVPSMMLWEVSIFIASESKSLRGFCGWRPGVISLTLCQDGESAGGEHQGAWAKMPIPGCRCTPTAACIQGPACVEVPPRPLPHDGI